MKNYSFNFFNNYYYLLNVYRKWMKNNRKEKDYNNNEKKGVKVNKFKRVNSILFSIYANDKIKSFKEKENKIYEVNKWINKVYHSNINLKMYVQNVQRLNDADEQIAWKKMNFIKDVIIDTNCDVFYLIDVGKKVNELIIPNYKLYNNGRDLLAVKNNIKLNVKSKLDWPIFEILNSDLRFVYIRPNEENKSAKEEVIKFINNNKCVIGDMNLKSNPDIRQATIGKMIIGENTGQTIVVQKKIKARINLINAPSDHKGLIIDIKKYVAHNAGVKLESIDMNQSDKMIEEIFEEGHIQTPITFKSEARINYGNEEEQITKDLLIAFLNNDLGKCYKTYENWWKKLKKEPFLGTEVPKSVEESLSTHYKNNPNKKYYDIQIKWVEDIKLEDLNPKDPSFSKAKTNEFISLSQIDKALKAKWAETYIYNEDKDVTCDKEKAKKFVVNFIEAANLNKKNQACKTFFLRKNKNRLELFHDVRIIIITPIFMKIWEALIYEKVMETLGPIVNEIPYQHGGIKNGSTYETLFDVQKKFKEWKGNGLLFVDIEKGYDSVDWEILHNMIDKIEDVSVKAMLKVWYILLINTNVSVNDTSIKKSRGLGMGLTLAPIIFVYYVNEAILESKINRGRIAMYIDDLSVVLSNETDIKLFYDIKEAFAKYKMNINSNKCSIISSNDKIKEMFRNHKIVVKDSEKYLGVQLRLDKKNVFIVDNRFLYIKNDFLCLPKIVNFAIKRLVYNGAILAKVRYAAMMFSIKEIIEKKQLMRLMWAMYKADFPMLSYLQLSIFSINYIRLFIDLNDLEEIKKEADELFDMQDRIKIAKKRLIEKSLTGIEQLDPYIKQIDINITDPRNWEITMWEIKRITDLIMRNIRCEFVNQWKKKKDELNYVMYEKIDIFIETKYVINCKCIQILLFRHFDPYKLDLNIFIIDIIIQISERIDKGKDITKNYLPKYDTIPKKENADDNFLKLYYNNRLKLVFKAFDKFLEIDNKKEYKDTRRTVIKTLCVLDNIIGYPYANKRTLEELFYHFNFKLAYDLNTYDLIGKIIDKQSDLYIKIEDYDMENAKNIFSVDGSFNTGLRKGGSGIAYKKDNKSETKKFFFETPSSFIEERNVAGELLATLWAIKKAVKWKLQDITIVFDYLGNMMYAKDLWSTRSKLSIIFNRQIKEIIKNNNLNITWVKVSSHTNNELNDLADHLAKVGSEVEKQGMNEIRVECPLRNRDYHE